MLAGNPKKQRTALSLCLFGCIFRVPFRLYHCVKLGALSLLLHKCLSDCFCELLWDLFWCLAVLLSLVAIACVFDDINTTLFSLTTTCPFSEMVLLTDPHMHIEALSYMHMNFLLCRSCSKALTTRLQKTHIQNIVAHLLTNVFKHLRTPHRWADS